MNQRIKRLKVAGFRSIKDETLEFSPVTVLIGPNGAGKSNFLWALEMLRLLAFESLQLFVSERGGATYLMHYGPRYTPAIELLIEFQHDDGHENAYEARLGYGADESLLFLSEKAGYRKDPEHAWSWRSLGAGHRESRLGEESERDTTTRTVRWLLRQINFYHFHDTSRRSPLRTRAFNDTADGYLRSDGSNLPAFLLALGASGNPADQAAWKRIGGLVQSVAPFVRTLVPQADPRGVSLDWVDERGETFGPAYLSDGTLRAIALIAALGQPEAKLPLLSCIDEPELGLHPAALGYLCGLVSSVSTRRQVLLSTQSPGVLDAFEASQVVVAERRDAVTKLKRLDEDALKGWLEDYSLSELFDKNVLGGRP